MIFLRPWILIFLCVPFILAWLSTHTGGRVNAWKQVIDKDLLPYLIVRRNNKTTRHRRWVQIGLWAWLIVAAAGPAWDKMPVPTRLDQPATVIVLDLSPAMSGTERDTAVRKIQDLLSLLPGEQVGLVIYDTYGYTAMPMTFEYDTLRDILPQLSSDLLPHPYLTDPATGLHQASQVLKNAGVRQGRILFFTTGADVTPDLAQKVQDIPHKIGVLGFGGPAPHPVALPNGGFWSDDAGHPKMVHPDPAALRPLGPYYNTTADDRDLRALLSQTTPAPATAETDSQNTIDLWQDRGVWLVVAALPFFALLFRKNMLFLLILGLCLPARAGWWTRPDQDAYAYQVQGVAAYRAGRYDKAESLFDRGLSPDDWYNRGNALAQQQKIDEAIDAYRQVLDTVPDHADALFNKEYLERKKQEQQDKQKQEQQEQDKQEQEQAQEQQDKQEQEQKQQNEQQDQAEANPQDQQNEQQNQNTEQEQEQEQAQEQETPSESKDTPNEQQEKTTEQDSPDQNQAEQTDTESEQESPAAVPPPEAAQPDTSRAEAGAAGTDANQQSAQQLINRLPRPPESLLRYRIYQQYQRQTRYGS